MTFAINAKTMHHKTLQSHFKREHNRSMEKQFHIPANAMQLKTPTKMNNFPSIFNYFCKLLEDSSQDIRETRQQDFLLTSI